MFTLICWLLFSIIGVFFFFVCVFTHSIQLLLTGRRRIDRSVRSCSRILFKIHKIFINLSIIYEIFFSKKKFFFIISFITFLLLLLLLFIFLLNLLSILQALRLPFDCHTSYLLWVCVCLFMENWKKFSNLSTKNFYENFILVIQQETCRCYRVNPASVSFLIFQKKSILNKKQLQCIEYPWPFCHRSVRQQDPPRTAKISMKILYSSSNRKLVVVIG